jgi:D-beta-D-heptose 7-phosphate kinase/D-beta-D-heptose 1-phosphate adenosyltransferase
VSRKRLVEILESLGSKKALVVGDVMLDRYIWGDVERISPEAPVPVLRVRREENRPGGAGSVVANLAALDAQVSVVSLVGDDRAGDELCSLLEAKNVDISGIVRMKEHGTTQKTRLLARVQQLLRVDRDHETQLTPELEQRLERVALERVAGSDVVLCSDYGKGVLAQGLARAVARAARKRGIPCVVDPFRAADFMRYEGATTITPNRKETENATEVVQDSLAAHERAATALIEKLGLDFATITLDKDGIFLKERGAKRGELYPSQARAVYDVAGAGDMVLSVLGLVLGGKSDPEDAVRLANVAAGLEVERLGVSPISKAEILRELDGRTPPALARKLVQVPELLQRVAEFRRQGKRIVFTNGCFDLMHAGHVRYFQFCRGLGDALVVAVNTDASVQRNKGPSRPIVELEERATVLAGLAAVDLVVAFDETTPIGLIEAVKPDVLVKGQDYEGKEVVGREFVEATGGRVELAPLWPGVSTTRIIERISAGTSPSPRGT